MDALHALHTRTSVNLLAEPGPTSAQLDSIVRAGLRACDHANLRPWHFLLIEGEAREKFGELMVEVKKNMTGATLSLEEADKLKSKPMRAPTILVVVAKVSQHEKVPVIEQVLSAGASAQMMMTAAHALGLGAIWRSGSLMFHESMRRGLGLNEIDQIVGFIYIGKPKAIKPVPNLCPDDYLTHWS